MNTLSISPRFDLFRFLFPKDFIPKDLEDKYIILLNKEKSTISTPIDYLNESIQGITLPGINDLIIEQNQHSKRNVGISNNIGIEPSRKNITYSTNNPLSQISMEFTVTMRQNQGLYNYFMMYEITFYKILKQFHKEYLDDIFFIDILNEQGNPVSRIKLFQPYIESIDGLSFNYNKTERGVETFDIKFRFNNIDFDFL